MAKIVAHANLGKYSWLVDGNPVDSIFDGLHKCKANSNQIYIAAIPSNYRLALTLFESVKGSSSRVILGSPRLYAGFVSHAYPCDFPTYLARGGVDVFSGGNWVSMCGKVEQVLYLAHVGLNRSASREFYASYLHELQREVGCESDDLFVEFVTRIVDPRWYVTDNGRMFYLEKLLGLRSKPSYHFRFMLRLYNSLSSRSIIRLEACNSSGYSDASDVKSQVIGCRYLVQYVVRKWLSYVTGHQWFDEKAFFKSRLE